MHSNLQNNTIPILRLLTLFFIFITTTALGQVPRSVSDGNFPVRPQFPRSISDGNFPVRPQFPRSISDGNFPVRPQFPRSVSDGNFPQMGQVPLSATDVNSPKVHMLFVWGTKATDTQLATMISKTKIEKALATPHDKRSGIGLGKNEPHVANYITLEGNNATAKNINDLSWKLSQAAGPNDAVFVYILCHGATTYENHDTNKKDRIHLFSPNCENAQNMKPSELGIRRSSIWRNITSKPHRLNMLITDSCTPLYQEKKKENRPFVGNHRPPVVSIPSESPPTESALYKVLMEGHGLININSTDPNGNNDAGELAYGWVPIIDGKTANLEEAVNTSRAGTIFTNAFIGLANKRIPINDRYTIDQFYNDLKPGLKKEFTDMINFLDKTGDPSIKTFESQGTQTLTKFNNNGTAIKK